MPKTTTTLAAALTMALLSLSACKDNGTVETQPGENPVKETVTNSSQSSDAPTSANVDVQPAR